MNRVVNILMKRDGYSKEEAMEILNDCREEINEAIASGDLLGGKYRAEATMFHYDSEAFMFGGVSAIS